MTRPSLRALFSNFASYDAPFAAKVKLLVANNVTKIRTKSDCCGRLGEPGC